MGQLEGELAAAQREEEELVRELEQLKVENSGVEEELEEQAAARERLEGEEELYWRQYSKHQARLLQAEDEYRSLDSQLKYTQVGTNILF